MTFWSWVYFMRWWLLIVLVLGLAYTVGMPHDMALLQWLKDTLGQVAK